LGETSNKGGEIGKFGPKWDSTRRGGRGEFNQSWFVGRRQKARKGSTV